MATFASVRAKLSDALAEANVASEATVAVLTQAAIDEVDAATGGSPEPPSDIRYRCDQPYLFQTVRANIDPDRLNIPGKSNGLIHEFDPTVGKNGLGAQIIVTPTHYFVDKGAGWDWDTPGGDLLDASHVHNGTAPWFTLSIQALQAVPHEWSVDVTAMQQFIQRAGRWNAIKLNAYTTFGTPSSNAPVFAGKFSATPPRIVVAYADGSSETLACRVTAVDTTATTRPQSTAPSLTMALGWFTEFEKPTKPVFTATLVLTQTGNITAVNTIRGYVIDPVLNSDPVQQGVAAGFVKDAGIKAHPSIMGAQDYADGVTIDDVEDKSLINVGAESNYSPEFWNRGAPDTTKLPYRSLGKWIGGQWKKDGSGPVDFQDTKREIIASTTPGFEPLAPGIGALRVTKKAWPGFLTDGVFCGSSAPNSSTTSIRIFLPAQYWGSDHIFVRYYFRLGSPQRQPYRVLPSDLRQLCTQALQPVPPIGTAINVIDPARAVRYDWSDSGGKMGIMPDGWSSYGGTSGVAGGGRGWQLRDGWHDFHCDDVGPDLGGIGRFLHSYDFGGDNPDGYNYSVSDDKTRADTGFGQRGGLGGVLYADQWYCLEAEVKLNEVFMGTWDKPGFVPNGELRYWVDGRLVMERTGMVMRSLPLSFGPTNNPYSYTDPGYKANALRPIWNLGLRSLWFNWFHGGITPETQDRFVDISQLAYGTQYIGPCRFA